MSAETLIVRCTEVYQSKRWVRIALVLLIVLFSALSVWFGYTQLHEESTKDYGYAGVFFINLITCATILVPVPGGGIVNITSATWMNPYFLTLVASLGATIGELTAYFAGSLGHTFLASRHSRRYKQTERLMNRFGAFAIFLFALMPQLLYDLIGLVAGSIRYPLWKLVIATFLGRVLRHAVQVIFGYEVLRGILFS